MRRIYSVLILLVLVYFGLSACGGGGAGSNQLNSAISGNVIKGPVTGAEIKVWFFDANGNEQEIFAENAPVIIGSSGEYTFNFNRSDIDGITSPLIVTTVGGTMGNPPAPAPTLGTVIADPAPLASQSLAVSAHLSAASSVAAGLLRKQAQETGIAPTPANTRIYLEKVE